MAAEVDDSVPDGTGDDPDEHRPDAPASRTEGGRQVPTVPGATDEVDVALLRLCRQMIVVTLRAGSRQDPVLSLAHIRMLATLAGARGPLSLDRLSVRLGQTLATVSSLGSQLVAFGLAERTVGPGTEIRLSLLPAGVQLLTAVNRHRLRHLHDLLDALPAADRAEVVRALARLGRQQPARDELW